MSQENKEILNILERQGLRLEEFRYCAKTGFIESAIMNKNCEDWRST
jgi:hypothetical protein